MDLDGLACVNVTWVSDGNVTCVAIADNSSALPFFPVVTVDGRVGASAVPFVFFVNPELAGVDEGKPLHPTPYTLHPTIYTLHLTPYTLHFTPCTPRPTPFTTHPAPHALHPTPHTLHPTSYTPHTTPYTRHPTPNTLHPQPNTQTQARRK